MIRTTLRLALTAVLLAGLLSQAAADKKGSKGGGASAVHKLIVQIDKKIAAARRTARSAQSRLNSISSRAAALGRETNGYKNEMEEAAANLASLEREIAAEAPSGSPFGQALARYEQARADLQAATDRVLNSAAFVAAQNAAGSPQAAAELRSQALDADAGVVAAQAVLRIARRAYEQELRKLLASNASYDRATASVSLARGKYNLAKQNLNKVLGERLAATTDLNRATALIAQLAAAKARAQYAARQAAQSKKSKGKKNKKGKKRRR